MNLINLLGTLLLSCILNNHISSMQTDIKELNLLDLPEEIRLLSSNFITDPYINQFLNKLNTAKDISYFYSDNFDFFKKQIKKTLKSKLKGVLGASTELRNSFLDFNNKIDNIDRKVKEKFIKDIKEQYKDLSKDMLNNELKNLLNKMVGNFQLKDLEQCAKLILAGADVNTNTYDGNTALTISAQKGKIEIVKFLISINADDNLTNDNGQNALLFAALNEHSHIVKLLIDNENIKSIDDGKANLNTQADALIWTIRYNFIKTINFLIEQGANVNAKNSNHSAPLMIAAQKGNLELVKFLIKKGANIHAKDNNAWTPLIFTAYYGHLKIVKFLIEQGANIDAKDNKDWSCLMYAALNGHLEIVKFLIEQGANIDARNNHGKTALNLAEESENQNLVILLKNNNN